MQPKIILIEDDSELRESLLEYLDLAGLNTTGVGSAIEFYQALNSATFDVAIIDIGLPDQSGFEIAKFLRGNTAMGIIILTARSSIEDRVQGYQAGADLYFTKPVDCQELVAAVKNLAVRLTSQQQSSLAPQKKEWVLDKTLWTLFTPDGTPIKLTGKEVNFLEVLIAQSGETAHREDLMHALGYDRNQYDNRALDALILRLRKKIEPGEEHNGPIKTVHAVGYCFSAPARIEQTTDQLETPRA